MACAIALTAVNGIVQPGQTDPTALRVTGEAQQCATGQVTVTSTITGPQTVTVDPNGRFRAQMPITATPAPHCGDLFTVRAECVGQATCAAQRQNTPLTCCEITQLFFQAVTPLGSLTPTQLSVQGTIRGCVTDQVVISSSIAATTGPIPVDPFTGGFTALLPITTPVQCDDKVTVTASCSSGSGCTKTVDDRLGCPECYRAHVTVVNGACTGTPPTQTQPVTLNADIALPAGVTQDFQWDFGDGSIGTPFTINNSTGNAATVHPASETHVYAVGTFTAKLKLIPPPFECPEVTVQVVVQCTTGGCPTITIDPPQVVGQCVNGKLTVTLTSHITAPAGQTVVVQWDYDGGGTMGPAVVVPGGTTVTDTQTHDYLPGTYTAHLKTVLPAGCPDKTVTVVVTCPPVPCTLLVQGITLQVGACDPATGKRTVTATGSVNSTDPADLYYWQWDSNPATVGLSAAAGTTQQHDYPAPGSGQSTYNVSLTVTRGSCVSTFTKPITIDGCGAGCPAIAATQIDAAGGVCTTDRLRRRVTLGATVNGTGVSQFVWDFGDGTTATLPGSAGPQTTHEFGPGTYTVNLKAVGPGNCEANFPSQITVDACCPEVTDITVSPGTCAAGATTRPVTLSAQVAGTGMSSFDWDFGDGSPVVTSTTPTAPSHNYAAPGTFTATVTAHTPNCPDVSATKSVSVATCGPGGGGGGGGGGLPACAALLWIAIIVMLIGAIVSIVGCVIGHFNAYVGLIVTIVGAAIFLIGALLFLLWWIICRFLTLCAVILAVRSFVMALIAIFAVVAVILAIIGIFYQDLFGCAALTAVYGFAWGGVLAMLDFIAQQMGCIILNPSGGSPSASGSSSLTSSEPTRRLRPSDFAHMTAQRPAGLGDVIASVTSAVGIQPCEGCHRRREALNARFPFSAASEPEAPAS